MIHISHPTRSVAVPWRADIAAILPHQRFSWEGKDMMGIYHGIDETLLLRNLNLPIPSPIIEHYSFPSVDGRKAFDKQVLTSSSMVMNPHSYVLNGMGTGKTKSAIWAFDYLKREGKANRMLVVAPLSTLHFTWEKEIMMTIPTLRTVVLSGSAERRKKLLAQDYDIYIVNHDGLNVIRHELCEVVKKYQPQAKRLDIDVVCFDEAAVYRNARALRSQVARNVTVGRKYVWAMTGSPTPSSLTDAFGLAWLVNPATAPRSFVQFRQDLMVQVNQFKWVPKKDGADQVAKLLQPAVRYSLDEVTELPPLIIHDPQQVDMSKLQRETYEQLRNYAAAKLKEGNINAVNGAALYSKLLQASIGWIYDNDHNAIYLDAQPRIDALLDIIEAAERKILLFSPFTSVTLGLQQVLEHHKIDAAMVYGDTPPSERNKIFNDFQHTDKYRVLNAHPECMSHGLTLTAADTIIWFGPVSKLETYEQANARITRVSQVHKQQVIRLVATPAERRLYTRLASKQDMQNDVLGLLKTITEEKL